VIDFGTTSGILRGVISGILVFLVLIFTACGEGGAGGESTGQNETTREASSAGRYVLPGEKVYPEGVAYDEGTGNFFVGSTTDGTIFRGSVEGDQAEVFLEPGSDGRKTAVGMKVQEVRLFIAGGDSGRMFVYDAASGELIRALDTPQSDNTFINDVAVTPGGDAYFTDSMRPILFKVSSTSGGVSDPEEWLDFEGTPVKYGKGVNLNGIAATGDGRYLITVQSNTGKLYCIDTASKKVVEIDLGGETLTNGDGLLLDGQTLYVVRNQQGLIFPVGLSEDFASGEVGGAFSDSSLHYPTTIAKYDDRLLVVNSQFDRRQSGQNPELPFTVSSIEIPPDY
jgi:sugar lactone lactonase YvrE